MPGSERHAGAVVPQLAGQDAAVDLVKLHELDEVGEAGLPVVHGEVEPSLLLARQDEIVLDFLQVAQGQDEALGVALALPHQEHA